MSATVPLQVGQASTVPRTAEVLPPRLAVHGLHVTRGHRVVLADVGFELAVGEVVGLLGPNGSGKTSLLQSLIGVLRPDRGTVMLDGTPLDAPHRALRARIGVVFQEPSLDGRLTAAENLELAAGLFAVPRAEAKRRSEELLAFVELADRAADLVSTLSGGSRRRVELARALIGEPHLLVLDEPTNGLDPTAFERTWQQLLALRRARELTMLVSTHRADEAQRCDRLLVLDRGRIVANDTPAAIMARLRYDILELEAAHPILVCDAIKAQLGLEPWLLGGTVVLEAPEAPSLVPRLMELFGADELRAVALRRPTLADAFFRLTGRALSEDTTS